MRRIRGVFGVVVVAALATATVLPAAPAHALDQYVIGHSVQGRAITVGHVGAVDAPVQLVVIGQMHGNETGGRKVISVLESAVIPEGVGIWLIRSMNPDGYAADRRTNAHAVDLNRNFPRNWRRHGAGTDQWSGRHAASEPETRAVRRFLARIRPTAVISYHQAYDLIDITHPRSRQAGRLLAGWMGERAAAVPCRGPCHGTLTQWVDSVLERVALTVELDDRVSDSEAQVAAAAVLRLGTWLGG